MAFNTSRECLDFSLAPVVATVLAKRVEAEVTRWRETSELLRSSIAVATEPLVALRRETEMFNRHLEAVKKAAAAFQVPSIPPLIPPGSRTYHILRLGPDSPEKDRLASARWLAAQVRPTFKNITLRSAYRFALTSVGRKRIFEEIIPSLFILAYEDGSRTVEWVRFKKQGWSARDVVPQDLSISDFGHWLFQRVYELFDEWLLEEAYGKSRVELREPKPENSIRWSADETRQPHILDSMVADERNLERERKVMQIMHSHRLTGKERRFVAAMYDCLQANEDLNPAEAARAAAHSLGVSSPYKDTLLSRIRKKL
jgi:hypothetical protein